MMFRQLTAKFNWWLKADDNACIFTCTVSASVAEKSAVRVTPSEVSLFGLN
jgi:hypothetical protein